MTRASLPLSAFEYLMVAQDSPAYPCVVYCKMHFDGKLDREAFLCSLREMFDRHPLLRSRVQESWRGLHWVHEDSERIPIQWLTDTPGEDWVSDSRLDLFTEVGTKVFVYDLPDACTILFQCHHACVDGLGMQSALDDLWLLYDSRTAGDPRTLPPYEPALLPDRNRFGMNIFRSIAAIPKQMVGLLGVRQYVMRQPVPIVPHAVISNTSPTPLPASCHIARFDKTFSKKLRQSASERNATLNDLIACAVFEAIAGFRRQRGHQDSQEWIRMMVPVNMRSTPQDHLQTACNIVSSVFLDRTPSQIEDRQRLLGGIHDEMELIKRNRLGLIFIASLWLKKQWPRRRSSMPPPERCQTTVVVTNVGRSFASSRLRGSDGYFRAGELKLESITMLAPMTPFLSAAITINEYAGELRLAMRYDVRILSRDAAGELLELVVSKLTSWIAVQPTREEAKSDG
jgi:NRPS condensation-like uncharacterized protein